MRRRNLTEYEKEVIYERWQDRIPTKVIALEDCTNTSQYLGLIEEIYNFRRRIKVNLRFSFSDIDTDTDS